RRRRRAGGRHDPRSRCGNGRRSAAVSLAQSEHPVRRLDPAGGAVDDARRWQRRAGMSERAWLVLRDGRAFRGRPLGAIGEAEGEVLFNTSMSGYQESLTDPSYTGQIDSLTYPIIVSF